MPSRETSNRAPEVEVEIQIIDLKDVYDKKTKKTNNGLEYRLENSEVTVVVRASDEITSVRAYTQRCAEAAIRTHDTIGKRLLSDIFIVSKGYTSVNSGSRERAPFNICIILLSGNC